MRTPRFNVRHAADKTVDAECEGPTRDATWAMAEEMYGVTRRSLQAVGYSVAPAELHAPELMPKGSGTADLFAPPRDPIVDSLSKRRANEAPRRGWREKLCPGGEKEKIDRVDTANLFKSGHQRKAAEQRKLDEASGGGT